MKNLKNSLTGSSFIGVVHEHKLQSFLRFLTQGSGDGNSLFLDKFEHFRNIFILVESGSRDHLVENKSNAPDIAFFAVNILFVSLRGHIPG